MYFEYCKYVDGDYCIRSNLKQALLCYPVHFNLCSLLSLSTIFIYLMLIYLIPAIQYYRRAVQLVPDIEFRFEDTRPRRKGTLIVE